MTLHATLLVQVQPEVFREKYRPAAGVKVPAGREALTGQDGTPFAMATLEDAVTVWTGAPFDAEPDVLSRMAVALLGPGLDAHGDDRGLYVFPDVATPRGVNYAAVVDELGEIGMWLTLPGRTRRPRTSTRSELEEQLRAVGGAVPPEAAARMQEALAGADPAMLDAARRQFEQMATEPGGMEAMTEQLAEMMGGGSDMGALLRQAQAQLAEMQKNDPAAFAALEAQALQMLSGLKPGGR